MSSTKCFQPSLRSSFKAQNKLELTLSLTFAYDLSLSAGFGSTHCPINYRFTERKVPVGSSIFPSAYPDFAEGRKFSPLFQCLINMPQYIILLGTMKNLSQGCRKETRSEKEKMAELFSSTGANT